MNYESIIVVTYGRSGSTLLQGMLNSIEGCLIRGENHLFCSGLFQSYQSLLKTSNYSGISPRSPWYGASQLDLDHFLNSCQILVKDLLLNEEDHNSVTCYGFKEIRYYEVISQFSEFLGFLEQIFPNLAFVFNTRDHDDVLKSSQKNHTDEFSSAAQLQELNDIFHSYCKDHNNAFLIDYRDLVGKSNNLKDLFSFLGAPYEEKQIDQVLQTAHSYGQVQKSVLQLKRDSVAICMTAKNESILLKHNLIYHRNIGVGKVYLYLDECTDQSDLTVSDLDFIDCQQSVSIDRLHDATHWGIRAAKIARFHHITHMSRQMLNMFDAYEKASLEGFDWLLCIDADELVFPSSIDLSQDALNELLGSYPLEVDMLNFLPIECLQNQLSYDNVVFEEQNLFKSAFLPSGRKNPQAEFFRKEISLPITGNTRLQLPYSGHDLGKVAVRTGRNLLPSTAHKFYHPKRNTRLRNTTYLVHYALYSVEDFVKKHKNFVSLPTNWLRGERVKDDLREWIDFVNDENTSLEQIVDYYRDNLLYSEYQIDAARNLRNSPLLQLDELPEYVRSLYIG